VPGIGGMRLCLLSEPGVAGEAGDIASMLPKVEARFVEPMDGERLASGRGMGGGAPRDKSVDCLVGAKERSSSDSSPSLGSICVFTGGGGGGTGRPGNNVRQVDIGNHKATHSRLLVEQVQDEHRARVGEERARLWEMLEDVLLNSQLLVLSIEYTTAYLGRLGERGVRAQGVVVAEA
jgi:hypothetical protein